GHGGRANTARGETFALKIISHSYDLFVASDNGWNDLAGASGSVPSVTPHGSGERARVFEQASALGIHIFREMQRGANLSGQIRWHRSAEDEGARVVEKVFFQCSRTADEGTGAGERFAASMHDGEDRF